MDLLMISQNKQTKYLKKEVIMSLSFFDLAASLTGKQVLI